MEPGGASHATGVSAEWPSLIGESANQLKNGNVFRTKILDMERKHFANGTIKFGEAWARRLSTRIEQRIVRQPPQRTFTTMDIYHTRHPPHKGTIRIAKNIWKRISRTIRTTGTMRTGDHKDHKDQGAIP